MGEITVDESGHLQGCLVGPDDLAAEIVFDDHIGNGREDGLKTGMVLPGRFLGPSAVGDVLVEPEPSSLPILQGQGDEIAQEDPSALHVDFFVLHKPALFDDLPDTRQFLVGIQIGGTDLGEQRSRRKGPQVRRGFWQLEYVAEGLVGKIHPAVPGHQKGREGQEGQGRI